MSGTAPSHRFHYLDGLRGYAALVVVICHFIAGFYPTAFFRGGEGFARIFSETPLLVLFEGPFAVFIFFVLSGFVLSGGEPIPVLSLPRQGVSRFLRLGIPAGASVLLSLAILKAGFTFTFPAADAASNPWIAQMYPDSAFPLSQALRDAAGYYFYTGATRLNTVLWTMRMELIGSFFIFTVSVLDRGKYRVYGYLLGFAVAAALSFKQSGLYIVPFVIGALIRETGVHLRPALSGRAKWGALFVIGLLFGGVPLLDATGTIYEPIVWLVGHVQTIPLDTLRIIGAGCVLLSVVKLRPAILDARFSRWLGKVSFSLYLTHWLVFVSFACFVYLHVPQALAPLEGLIFIAACLAVAALFHRFVEDPAINLARRLRGGQRRAVDNRLEAGAALP